MNEENKQKSGCLILCGGKSRRMKQDKAKLIYKEKSFLEIICTQVRKMGMSKYISVNDDKEIPEDFKILKDEICDENGELIGPMGGIYTGLKQCVRDGLEGMYTVAVDQPLFEKDLFDLIEKEKRNNPHADIYVLVSTDGRIHPVTAYYRSSIFNTMEELIHAHDYKLMSLIRHPDLQMVCVKTENDQQDRMLRNVNTPADYEALINKHKPKHIVLQAEKGAGKTTLIQKLIKDLHCTVGGYLTRAVMNREKGYREIYMYPASFIDADDQDTVAKEKGKLCGITMNGVKEVYPEVFNTYGTRLIHSASKKELILMDEIGFMEENAEEFKRAVLSVLDGNIPVIASIKVKTTPYLETVRHHENIELIEVDETNRNEIYEQLRTLYRKAGL